LFIIFYQHDWPLLTVITHYEPLSTIINNYQPLLGMVLPTFVVFSPLWVCPELDFLLPVVFCSHRDRFPFVPHDEAA
jgi:hypothetical protein